MPELQVVLADGESWILINLPCSLMQRKKPMERVLLDLNLNAEC